MAGERILVVDDDEHVCELVGLYLEKEGYVVKSVFDGREALKAAAEFSPDLILLDLMLPKVDGLSVCQQLRTHSSVPIIMLTAKDEEVDRVLGLELGADDYITKPFSPREVAARVKAVLRRTAAAVEEKRSIDLPSLHIDLGARQVTVAGVELTLTRIEFDLLVTFARAPNRVFTREELLRKVWRYSQAHPEEQRTVDTHVKRLREKLGVGVKLPFAIQTIWGVGYKFQLRE